VQVHQETSEYTESRQGGPKIGRTRIFIGHGTIKDKTCLCALVDAHLEGSGSGYADLCNAGTGSHGRDVSGNVCAYMLLVDGRRVSKIVNESIYRAAVDARRTLSRAKVLKRGDRRLSRTNDEWTREDEK
jgi:hypothetical protein